MDREQAVARLETLVDRVERETMPVPVREVWAFGDVALGLDPVERLDVYLTKDVIMGGDSDAAANFAAEYGVKGVGTSVHAEWAEAHPDRVRTSDNGYAAPRSASRPNWSTTARRGASGSRAKPDDSEPIHLEVCNASFEDNVRQRLKGALARDAYEEVLDPRGASACGSMAPATRRRSTDSARPPSRCRRSPPRSACSAPTRT